MKRPTKLSLGVAAILLAGCSSAADTTETTTVRTEGVVDYALN